MNFMFHTTLDPVGYSESAL